MRKSLILIEGRREVIEWWDRSDFHGRINLVCPQDEKDQIIQDEVTIIPVEDDCIVCDWCNADITLFPVPVLESSALCPGCFSSLMEKAQMIGWISN